jgi:NAD(P)-dependent dehydrogenase (short-subunit alcohol dehydrogenase family)
MYTRNKHQAVVSCKKSCYDDAIEIDQQNSSHNGGKTKMGIYVITGGTTGIGAIVREQLLEQGHEVFNIDYKDGDYCVDLSTHEGRESAISAVIGKYPDGIDGLICNAGVGPTAPPRVIFSLNYYSSIRLAEGLRPILKKKKGNCVITSSNSITNMTVRLDWVNMLLSGMSEERVMDFAQDIPREQSASCYSSSKHALARWVRRVSASWAVDGMRINTVAPGNTTTPMTKNLTEAQKDAALLIPIPTRYGQREFLDAVEIANAIVFLSSKLASGINGVVLFVDGGIDALLRSERF